MLIQRHFIFIVGLFLQFYLVYKSEIMCLGWIDFIFTLKLGDDGREKEERKGCCAFFTTFRSILLLVLRAKLYGNLGWGELFPLVNDLYEKFSAISLFFFFYFQRNISVRSCHAAFSVGRPQRCLCRGYRKAKHFNPFIKILIIPT